jgi:hypothetical protein
MVRMFAHITRPSVGALVAAWWVAEVVAISDKVPGKTLTTGP